MSSESLTSNPTTVDGRLQRLDQPAPSARRVSIYRSSRAHGMSQLGTPLAPEHVKPPERRGCNRSIGEVTTSWPTGRSVIDRKACGASNVPRNGRTHPLV